MNRTNLQQFNILETLLTDKLEQLEKELKKYASKMDASQEFIKERAGLITQIRQFQTLAAETISSEYIAGFDAGKIYASDTKQRIYTSETKEQFRASHELEQKNKLSHLY